MLHKIASLSLALTLAAVCLSAQDRNLNASKNDWEEINFEYNSAVLVDGFPSLLRLGELLQRNPGYKVAIEGHTDRLGSASYNDKLGLSRANAVRDFLVKYGARANQLTVATRGKAAEKYPGSKNVYTRTDEARWMNRRVVLTVSDDQGRTVSDGSAGEAIRAIEPPKPVVQAAAPSPDCCNEVLKRLDKLDEIAQMLKDMAAQNAALQKQVDDLKAGQQSLQAKVDQTPKPPTTEEVASAVSAEIEKKKDPRFELLGLNVGENSNSDITFTGKGRFFAPFGPSYALQAQGEYYYSKGQKEGQFDLGLVDRIGRFQAGLFSSFKHVTLAGDQTGGTLGQGSLTLDYIFGWGRIGVFGTKSFLDNALVNTANGISPTGALMQNVLFERYLKVVDTAGLSTSVGLFGNTYLEGNVGYLKSVTAGDRAGGTLRFIFPLNTKIALTLEGGVNETLLGTSNNGRAVVGVQFGNMMRPKEFLAASHAIPVDVPRVRYEVLTRRVQIGNSPPVADAGPNQIGVAAGTITLNGSASYDPDGNPITYAWTQIAGPAVVLATPTKAITTFTAAAGESYAFRLTVRDNYGAEGTARTLVTTTGGRPTIVSFTANPTQINAGQSSTLSWQVTNADNVTITVLGRVQPTGNAQVSPNTTTTYVLTATNAGGAPVTASATVTVISIPTLQSCTASPASITAGQSTTLNYTTTNTTSVNISPGVGSGPLQGGITVSPNQTTTYTIVAVGASGTVSCSIAVNVTPLVVTAPRIVSFTANPTTITAGQSSTLTWAVQNADTVTITSLGNVALNGSQAVSPTVTTTYTLTATNASGPVTAQATVTVNPVTPPTPPSITSFTATPPTSPSPGSPVKLTCIVANASTLTIAGTAATLANNTVTVNPTQDTTYTCVATNAGGQTASQSVTVKVTPTPPPAGPTVIIAGGNSVDTIYRFNYPDISGSFSPQGNNPLTYHWVDEHNSAAILNPNSATPVIQLGLIGGLYYFDVTVTDSKGNSTTVVYTINFHNVKVN